MIKLLVAILGKWKINSLNRNRFKKMQNLKTAHSLFEKFETDFEKQFFENEWKETCFFMQSEIDTNYQSISKYIRLKDKLGLNFNWKQIKEAQLYLDLKNYDIKVNLNKSDRFTWKLVVSIFALCLVSVPFIFSFLSQFKNEGLLTYLAMYLLGITPLLISYGLLLITYPIFTAEQIEKRLKHLQEL
ncbi:MAG: hypothetical protein ABI892_17750 [Flavobacterium sp.]